MAEIFKNITTYEAGETDIDGITAEIWGKEQFEFEYCSECGKDWDEHDYILILGHWFARCRDEKNEV